MSNQKTFDPFFLWKEYQKNTESYWGQVMDEKMKTEEFSEWLGKVVDFNMTYKQIADKSAKQYLEQMNIPSREDLANLSSLIVNLDTKVDDLEELVEQSLEVKSEMSPTVVKKEITTLKKEVKEISNKLDVIFEFLKENQAVKSNPTSNKTDIDK
ncbi:poly(R)-hydroxyalkanoic acid synthase subunit PhaE [Anaerobacillus isosaccharinicus]|uniref:Poly(3-hydroxyalkanoate) polymerase subunit PhaE n=1 Tax=Anaerobacillus isosaccharinicus TaxID=1532552 RepID=A0A1S2LGR7_9BACI|nr:poly(R)-hydroxyalkanoic acid synthase subunit PhaE [Anaerobacillus isosaccharinicus]MBA5586916.1 polyhydroxyalkanoic acid synthase subunit PhaR [Anaerobacillus isosaccharinicus]QOY34877.1 polyhydroxyalkanoic acid synthase subunit PhaR [Anaerobacillus isosaccharinicus]